MEAHIEPELAGALDKHVIDRMRRAQRRQTGADGRETKGLLRKAHKGQVNIGIADASHKPQMPLTLLTEQVNKAVRDFNRPDAALALGRLDAALHLDLVAVANLNFLHIAGD